MKKSVFKRFVVFSLAIALVCVIVVGGIVAFPLSRYIENSKRSTLEETTQTVSELAGKISNGDLHFMDMVERRIFKDSMDAFSSSFRATTTITDTRGLVIYSSNPEFTGGILSIPQEIIDAIHKGGYYEHGNLNDNYKHQYYIAIQPITSSDGYIVGYCVVSQANLWTADYIPTIFTTLIVIIVLTALLIFIISAVYAYNTTLPLKKIAGAVKRFSVGDLESRGLVKTQDELGEISQAFNEMADSLASSEGMRRNFIANVSHELKTPMTTIAGYIDGILDGTIPEKDQKHYLGIVSQEVKRLSRLVGSMISLSKIDSGEITVKKAPFVIQDTAFNVLTGFENDIYNKHLNIEGMDCDEDIITYGDSDLIHQVIYNLVENAVKFTNEGGYIRFDFSKKDGATYVTIENSGEGILPEDLKLVFDKFYKGDKSRSINKKSMGLGLYIVKTIIRLHDGDIYVESEPGKYCRFTFHIPDEGKKKKDSHVFSKETHDE